MKSYSMTYGYAAYAKKDWRGNELASERKPVQIDLFDHIDPPAPAGQVLNGMYYEKATDKFVSFVLGRRHYEEPARGCPHDKEWQQRLKRERSI
ncbi:hypothetical protein ACI2LM_15635 [Paenibacillus lautus]|uniref:hypothetical protein n=1 Tax=Paenibacillus lautus TaxID=1401 RepID=UPI00384BB58E